MLTCHKEIEEDLLDQHLDKTYDCTNTELLPQELNRCWILQFGGSVNTEKAYIAGSEAGFPLVTYNMLTIHLNNFENEQAQFNHSMRLWHTGKLRKFEMGATSFGGIVGLNDSILNAIHPPGVDNFRTRHVMSTYCFNEVWFIISTF